MEECNATEESPAGGSLIDLVFSWSITDVLNKDLYKGQVKKIPKTFTSTSEYINYFIPALVEETHADLLSSMTMVSSSPSREILSISVSKGYKLPKDLFYQLSLEKFRETSSDDKVSGYKPQVGDVIALTNVARPTSISDLNTPIGPCLLAYVHGSDGYNSDTISVLSSKPVMFGEGLERRNKTVFGGKNKKKSDRYRLFAVYLTNLTTNIRIWKALNSVLGIANLNIINNILQTNPPDGNDCADCLMEGKTRCSFSNIESAVRSSGLNDSQSEAIISCIRMRQCYHQNTVKLIWGPPGTGKTKTVGLLLKFLLHMKCRTLTCAPTNIAVLNVTERLVRVVKEKLEFSTYGLGDIVLFGNGERMNISDYDELVDVFLDYRASVLCQCFHPLHGWEPSLLSMMDLLKDPEALYRRYLSSSKDKTSEEEDDEPVHGMCGDEESQRNQEKPEEVDGQNLKDKSSSIFWKKEILQALKEKNTKEKRKKKEPKNKQVENKKSDKKPGSKKKEPKNKQVENKKSDEKPGNLPTLEEFLKKQFKIFSERLQFCMENLYTHMPTCAISIKVVKKMFIALRILKSLDALLLKIEVSDTGLKQVLYNSGNEGIRNGNFQELGFKIKECLLVLGELPRKFVAPKKANWYSIQQFCLANACLLFCTASSSSKLHTKRMRPLELLVVDEAAQFKECESTIALQLPGLRHAVLIGDERQLPAMVQSKISEKAKFGRSLFERLVLLKYPKHLLNAQYRMHPSISLFPNREFYAGQIKDAAVVTGTNHQKRFLSGTMYGPYSFINISQCSEQSDDGCSMKNLVEVAVISSILARLFQEFTKTKKRMSVGIISPYKAQVKAIQDKIGKIYSANSNFFVRIRSVDGFQGGEEDVVIISTVRCNRLGSVGFLSSRQRTNVALTRAKYCLWILGNASTLVNSNTIWKKLVVDAENRGCFHNADDDKNLAEAVVNVLTELGQIGVLLNSESVLFRNAKWKVCLSDNFRNSIVKLNVEIQKKVIDLLGKLSSGWRQSDRQKDRNFLEGTCADELLKKYKIKKLGLIWAVDIVRENSYLIQVLQVWDILPLSAIPVLEERLAPIFENYTVDKVKRCKHKSIEGNLVVPMKWPAGFTHSSYPEENPEQILTRQLASLTLGNRSEASESNSDRHILEVASY